MNRITFLVDGFNVYHSLKEAQRDLNGASTRWLDLHSLFSMYVSSSFGRNYKIEDIFYFSAYATHREQRRVGVIKRHKDYIECLKSTGVKDVMGRFKPKKIHCHSCHTESIHHEEKETDVAISIKLFELLHLDLCDTAVLVTGDTDLAPAVRTAQEIFTDKEIAFIFPYKRKNGELEGLVDTSIYIKKERYVKHQFAESMTMKSGTVINKPDKW